MPSSTARCFIWRLAPGKLLLIDLIALKAPEQTASYIAAMQEKLARLKALLHEWHGPVPGVEDDFAAAMREIAQGKEVDLEKALTEKPL